jgi:hypothetical protein
MVLVVRNIMTNGQLFLVDAHVEAVNFAPVRDKRRPGRPFGLLSQMAPPILCCQVAHVMCNRRVTLQTLASYPCAVVPHAQAALINFTRHI